MARKFVKVRLEVSTQKVRDDLEGIIASIPEFLLTNSSEPESCDILIHELGEDPRREFGLIQELTQSGEVGEFLLTSARTEPEILISALRSGAKEFISQPINNDEVRQCLLKALERRQQVKESAAPVKQGHVIDVLGSKGGVGTTTTAVNLAAGLKRVKGVESVALIDMNLIFGEVPLFLDIKPAFSWGEIARNIERLDSTYLMGILSKHNSGIHVLPPPTQLDGLGVTTPDVIERILLLMKEDFDYIVIDSGQALDPVSLKILELSDLVFVMAILSLPCLINLKRLLDTFGTLGYPNGERTRVVMNRYQKNTALTTKEAEEGIQKKISWLLPNEYQTTMSAINQGKLIQDVSKKSEIAQSFKGLAESIVKELGGPETHRGLFGKK